MTKKKKNANKISRRERNEHLTNWYMINLCWAIVGIFALLGINGGYQRGATIIYMQPLMWILTGVFAVGALVVFCLGKYGVIKNKARANNYSIFLGVCSLTGLWLALYNKLRLVIEKVAQFILNDPKLTVGSVWNVYIPMILIGVYLVGAFIYLAVKVTRK